MFLYPLLNASEPSPSLLQDPFWQFVINVAVALLVGIGTAIVAIIIFRKQRNRREITYEVLSDAPLASINKAVENRVEVRLDGSPVKDARLLVINVGNTGNVAVKREDYDEPIKFVFKDREVISSDILSTEPAELIDQKDIKTFLSLGSETVELPKFLLNPKQEITLTVLLKGAKDKVRARARIVDGDITELVTKRPRAIKIALPAIVVGILIALINVSIILFFPQELLSGHNLSVLGSLFLSLMFMSTVFLSISVLYAAWRLQKYRLRYSSK